MTGMVPRTGAGVLMRVTGRAACRAAFLAASIVAPIAAPIAATGAEAAERQIRPFIGATFGGGTSFVDLENAAGTPNPVLGVSAVVLGDIFGAEVDIADAPGFFETGNKHLVLSSRVTTVTANMVVGVPRHLTEYSLRPYFVGGAGLIRVRIDDVFGALQVTSTLPGFDVGGGVVGSLSRRFGVCWEVRRFQSLVRDTQDRGVTFGEERVSFWRASMGLAIRY